MLDEFTYLAGKNDHILDDPGGLVLQELRNDVAADDTGPDNGEVCVSGHEILSDCVCDLPFLYLYPFSEPTSIHLGHIMELFTSLSADSRVKADALMTAMSHSSIEPEPVECCY
jgi:hypothetical protein